MLALSLFAINSFYSMENVPRMVGDIRRGPVLGPIETKSFQWYKIVSTKWDLFQSWSFVFDNKCWLWGCFTYISAFLQFLSPSWTPEASTGPFTCQLAPRTLNWLFRPLTWPYRSSFNSQIPRQPGLEPLTGPLDPPRWPSPSLAGILDPPANT